MNIWITTWMSLRFGLIAAILGIEVSFFIDYYSRQYLWSR
jgi:ABC-type Fe3+ transport system permease subunit